MPPPILNRPLWLERAATAYARLEGDLRVDVAVVGAGMTGVTTAHLLKQAGKTVALLDSSGIALGATGYTTAKVTAGHGLIYQRLIARHGQSAARDYARSNQNAIERLARLVDEQALDCDFERASNVVYSESRSAVADVEREAEAARSLGLAAELTSDTDLPYPIAAAVRLPDQAQFHPWKYASALARLVDGEGSRVFELTRATAVRSGRECVVETATGTVRARHVVLATQLPFVLRGLFFAKAHPGKSYAVAATVDESTAPRQMYLSVDRPTRSVRSAPAAAGRRVLIVGGEGHKPGTADGTEQYARLERFLGERFGGATAEYRWSTHDFMPVDLLPYIGRVRRGDDRVLVATGFAKWGMTKGILAAEILADAVLGRTHPYAGLYDSTRLDARRSGANLIKENALVGVRFVGDRVRGRDGRAEVQRLEPGSGTIARVQGKHYAVFRDDAGVLHTLSARCTHLGCIVGWNAADRAWECPCHGSRFAADGTLVQGPATADLPPRALPG